jgi:hypothetical protein
MSRLLFADPGGEYYFSLSMASAITAGIWNESGSGWSIVNSAPAGRQAASDGNSYALFNSSTGGWVGRYLSSSLGHIIAGYAVYTPSSGWATNQQLIAFTNGTTFTSSSQCDVRIADGTGHLKVTNNGTQRGSTSTQTLSPGWHYIELDVTFATGATGTADVWVDGIRWINATSVITATTVATANRVYFQQLIGNANSYFKDMCVIDGSVSPNTPLGDVTVGAFYANGAGVNSQWAANVGPFTLTSVNGSGVYQGTITGGASNAYVGFNFVVTGFVNGANNITAKCTASTATALTLNATTTVETHAGSAAFQCVVQDGINHSGTRPDADVTYISDSTANDISDFAHEALNLVGTIYGVIHVSYVKKDDAGARAFRQVCLSGGTTETNGADLGATNSYLYYFDPMDLNPNTSTAWTPTTYNAATMGVKEIT